MLSFSRFLLLGPIVAVLSLTGCNESPFEPELANKTDDFQFQVTGVQGVTETQEMTWENTGTLANVNHSCQIAAGTARLTLRDANGVQVYSRNLAENGTFGSGPPGVAGDWTIRVELTDVSGTLNFRVQRGG